MNFLITKNYHYTIIHRPSFLSFKMLLEEFYGNIAYISA